MGVLEVRQHRSARDTELPEGRVRDRHCCMHATAFWLGPMSPTALQVFRRAYEAVGLGWVYAITKYVLCSGVHSRRAAPDAHLAVNCHVQWRAAMHAAAACGPWSP